MFLFAISTIIVLLVTVINFQIALVALFVAHAALRDHLVFEHAEVFRLHEVARECVDSGRCLVEPAAYGGFVGVLRLSREQ